jgi:hypothetical protein
LTYYVCFFLHTMTMWRRALVGWCFWQRQVPRWQTFSGGREWPATTLIGEAFWDPQSSYSDVCAWKIHDKRVNQVVKTVVINTKKFHADILD